MKAHDPVCNEIWVDKGVVLEPSRVTLTGTQLPHLRQAPLGQATSGPAIRSLTIHNRSMNNLPLISSSSGARKSNAARQRSAVARKSRPSGRDRQSWNASARNSLCGNGIKRRGALKAREQAFLVSGVILKATYRSEISVRIGRLETFLLHGNAGAIAQGALRAAKSGNIEEVRYLGEETIKALSGDPLGVQCPGNIPDPPKPYAQKQLRQLPPELFQLFNLLMKSTEEQASRLSRTQKAIPELTEKKKDAEKKVEEKKQELEQVKQKAADPKKPEEVKEKKGAMAQALAALKTSQAALAEADKAVREENKGAERANQALARNKEMFEKAQANPDRAAELLNQLQNAGGQARR